MERKIQLNLYLLERHRDMLQRMAAKRMLENPSRSVTASRIAAEIISGYFDRLEKKETIHDEASSRKEPE
jgi:hypothetical protein